MFPSNTEPWRQRHRLRLYLLAAVVFAIVIFMANLNALVDLRFNPELAYLSEEHLVVGGISAAVTLILFGLVAMHAGYLERALARQRKAARALSLSEEKYRSLFEQSKDAVFIETRQGRFLDINPAGMKMFGYDSRDEMLKLDIASDLYVDRSEWLARQDIMEKNGFVENLELVLKKKNGEQMVVLETATSELDDEGRIHIYRGTLRDVTRQQQLEAELNQMHKMESVGKLAGGIAHDFNNHLTTISGRAEMALSGLNGDVQLRENIQEIINSVDKASCLTRQLLLFSRSQPLNMQPADLNTMISGIRFTLNRILDDGITISLRLQDELPPVEADLANLELVIMNLALYLGDSGAGDEHILIATSRVTLDESFATDHAEAYSGDFVSIDIIYSGHDNETENGTYIFEPFSRTGTNGRSGMGLAVAYGIVLQHGGWIEDRGEQGHPRQYRIYLPAGTRKPRSTSEQRAATGNSGKGEHILLVEDEAAVRETLAKMLEESGYQVSPAVDAEQAFEIFVRMAGDVQLLFSDVALTGEGGVELAGHLRSHKPDLPVILCSGFADREEDLRAIREHDYRFLQKPFFMPELLKTVSEELGQQKDPVSLN